MSLHLIKLNTGTHIFMQKEGFNLLNNLKVGEKLSIEDMYGKVPLTYGQTQRMLSFLINHELLMSDKRRNIERVFKNIPYTELEFSNYRGTKSKVVGGILIRCNKGHYYITKTQHQVIRFLLANPDRRTGGDVHTYMGASHQFANRAVVDLVNLGLVSRKGHSLSLEFDTLSLTKVVSHYMHR